MQRPLTGTDVEQMLADIAGLAASRTDLPEAWHHVGLAALLETAGENGYLLGTVSSALGYVGYRFDCGDGEPVTVWYDTETGMWQPSTRD